MSHLEIQGGEYDDLIGGLPSSNENESRTVDNPSPNLSLDLPSESVPVNTDHRSSDELTQWKLFKIFDPIPPSVMGNIEPITHLRDKQTRFRLASTELEHALEKRIKSILPCARLEFQPNKANVPDVKIHEGNKALSDGEKSPCDIPNREVGSINFIYQDRPNNESSSKYVGVMFFHFKNDNEFKQIAASVIDFFKELDRPIRGGKRLKKTQKKKSKWTKKQRSKSKRRSRK